MPSIEYDAALTLADMGMYLFPLHTARWLPNGVALCTCTELDCKGKHPRVAFSKESTRDRQQIDQWWNNNREPAYGIGIHLGMSHLWVLDIDGTEGIAELKQLTDQYGDLPETLTVLSGSGNGRHYFFTGWVDKVHSGVISHDIHIKGNQGHAYVCGPGTLHVSGNRYQFLNRYKQ